MTIDYPLTSIGGLVEGSYRLSGEQSREIVLAPVGMSKVTLVIAGSFCAMLSGLIILCGCLAQGPVMLRIVATAIPTGISLAIGTAFVGCAIWSSRVHMRGPTLMSYDGQRLFLWGRAKEVAASTVTEIELIKAKCVEHVPMQSGVRKEYTSIHAIVVHHREQSREPGIVVAHLRGTISSTTMQGLQQVCTSMGISLTESRRDLTVNLEDISAYTN